MYVDCDMTCQRQTHFVLVTPCGKLYFASRHPSHPFHPVLNRLKTNLVTPHRRV